MNRKTARAALLSIILIFAMILPACGKDASGQKTDAPNVTAAPAQEQVQTEAPVPEEDTETFILANADFEEILDRCQMLLTAEDPGEIMTDEDEPFMALFEKRLANEPEEALKSVGYSYTDLNGDGENELLIAGTDSDTDYGFAGNLIYAVFAKDGSGSRTLFYGWSRNRYYSLGDSFMNEGSSGASAFSFGTFRVEGTPAEVVWNEMVFCDGDTNQVFENQTGSLDAAQSAIRTGATGDTIFQMETEAEANICYVPVESFALRALPVSVTMAENAAADWIMLDDTEYAAALVFSAEETVTDFKVYRLTMTDVREDGTPVYDSEERYSCSELPAGDSIGIRVEFPGDTPCVGVSYIDSAGNLHQSALSISGYDGSLVQIISEF